MCATYGRFSRLRDAISCFLEQDYPNKRMLILNDAQTPIEIDSGLRSVVTVVNEPKMFDNLGAKRQALLERAETELVAQWDDDDLYLPWHLSRTVAALHRPGVDCVKSAGGWSMLGSLLKAGAAPPPESLTAKIQVKGIHHNVFEGTMGFRREAALKLGGYRLVHSGQAKALLEAFGQVKRQFVIPDQEPVAGSAPQRTATTVSYVYRWNQAGVGNISAIGNAGNALQRFAAGNRDFGDGQPLAPHDVSMYWPPLLANAKTVLAPEDFALFEKRFAALL